MKCIFYNSKSTNAYENLAVEEYLFDNLRQGFFVFYLWQNKNTVVIGRNQNAYLECKVESLLDNGGKLARRMSGGGAVYHDLGNLNFTFIFNKDDYDLLKNFSAIILALKKFNINAVISGRNDMTVDNKKISGNAFLNVNNKVCHHGTLLVDADIKNMTKFLKVDKQKLLKNGVHSVKGRVSNLNEFNSYITVEKLKVELLSAVNEVFKPTEIINANIENVEGLKQKFSSQTHIFGANASFLAKASERYDWGKVDIDYTVKSGRISNIDICTDSLEVESISAIKQQLVNCKIDEMKNLINNNKIKNDIVKLIEGSI